MGMISSSDAVKSRASRLMHKNDVPYVPTLGTRNEFLPAPEEKVIVRSVKVPKECASCVVFSPIAQTAQDLFKVVASTVGIELYDHQNRKDRELIVPVSQLIKPIIQAAVGDLQQVTAVAYELVKRCQTDSEGRFDIYEDGTMVGYHCGATDQDFPLVTPVKG